MKRAFSIICFLLLAWMLPAQNATALLQKVSSLLTEKKWDAATELFQQAVGKDVERSDIYYRAEVDKSSPVAIPFAIRLAIYYKNTRDYNRAYNYYKLLLTKDPDNASYLSGCAESALGKGQETEAVELYDKVINLNPKNLRANIFLGSYYFMEAERQKHLLDNNFKRIATPTTMQRAHYKDALKALYISSYLKAKHYLESVLKLFPSAEAKKMVATINEREKEMD